MVGGEGVAVLGDQACHDHTFRDPETVFRNVQTAKNLLRSVAEKPWALILAFTFGGASDNSFAWFRRTRRWLSHRSNIRQPNSVILKIQRRCQMEKP